jgi:hypothetical protein
MKARNADTKVEHKNKRRREDTSKNIRGKVQRTNSDMELGTPTGQTTDSLSSEIEDVAHSISPEMNREANFLRSHKTETDATCPS